MKGPDLSAGPPVVGVVGGGQLARMMYQAAIPLGIDMYVLAADGVDRAARVDHGR